MAMLTNRRVSPANQGSLRFLESSSIHKTWKTLTHPLRGRRNLINLIHKSITASSKFLWILFLSSLRSSFNAQSARHSAAGSDSIVPVVRFRGSSGTMGEGRTYHPVILFDVKSSRIDFDLLY